MRFFSTAKFLTLTMQMRLGSQEPHGMKLQTPPRACPITTQQPGELQVSTYPRTCQTHLYV